MVAGAGPQSNVMTPPAAMAVVRSASVHDAAVPFPTTVVGDETLTGVTFVVHVVAGAPLELDELDELDELVDPVELVEPVDDVLVAAELDPEGPVVEPPPPLDVLALDPPAPSVPVDPPAPDGDAPPAPEPEPDVPDAAPAPCVPSFDPLLPQALAATSAPATTAAMRIQAMRPPYPMDHIPARTGPNLALGPDAESSVQLVPSHTHVSSRGSPAKGAPPNITTPVAVHA